MTLDEALEDVEIAFLQVEFAIKLLAYCELEKIDASVFDADHIVLLENKNLEFPRGNYGEATGIIRAAKVAVALAFGASALALDQAYEVAGIDRNPSSDDGIVALRTVVFMVRCAYAHGIADPKWEVQGSYRRPMQLDLGNTSIDVDLQHLDGQDFRFEHLGGHQNWFHIKEVSVGALRDRRRT